MKVVEETRTRLVINHQPIRDWLLGWLIVVFGLSFWIYSIAFDFTYLSLVCNRSAPPEINCELKRVTFLGGMEKIKIFDPQEAYIQEKSGSKGGKSYQIIIVSKLGDFSLLPHLSYQENEYFLMEFNRFINSSQSFFISQENQRNYLFIITIFMLFMTGIGIYLATLSATTCTFYKSMNKVLIERKGLLGNKVVEYPLEAIATFIIQSRQHKFHKLYRAVIFIKSGQQIPINPQYTDKKDVEYVVDKIRQFLNFQY